nr:hypothetical protein [Tanacetum cinerariifolium]
MDMTIDQQVALDEALVPHASRLRIGKSNFHLRQTSRLRNRLFKCSSSFNSFQDEQKVVNLEYFREMLHICPRIPNQTFDELLFEEEILEFLRYLGHSGEIKRITDVNINHGDHLQLLSTSASVGKLQVEHKDANKSNEMYYLRFIKVIINFFMTKDPLIPRKNKVNWHYVRDDQMFTTSVSGYSLPPLSEPCTQGSRRDI